MERQIEKFVRYLEIEKNYSPYTVVNYRLDLNDFRRFLGESTVEKVDYLALRKYLALLKEKNLSSRTVGRRLATLRSFFNHQPFQPQAGKAPAFIYDRGRGEEADRGRFCQRCL